VELGYHLGLHFHSNFPQYVPEKFQITARDENWSLSAYSHRHAIVNTVGVGRSALRLIKPGSPGVRFRTFGVRPSCRSFCSETYAFSKVLGT
jgi:hypothetical protein